MHILNIRSLESLLISLARQFDISFLGRLRSKLKELADQYDVTQQKYAHQVCYLGLILRSLSAIKVCTSMVVLTSCAYS
jgi:hypothetical protein